MNPKLHFWLCLGITAAGGAAATLVALDGSRLAIAGLIAVAYGLGVFSHYALMATTRGREARFYWAVAAIWPLVGLWLLIFALLPAPAPEGPSRERAAS